MGRSQIQLEAAAGRRNARSAPDRFCHALQSALPHVPGLGLEDEKRSIRSRALWMSKPRARCSTNSPRRNRWSRRASTASRCSFPICAKVFADMKERGIAIAMNTNGLTLTEDLAEFFCRDQSRLDHVQPRFDDAGDAWKVRGVDKLAKIEAAVFRMLRVRGDRELPRVGVSFTRKTPIVTRSRSLSIAGSGSSTCTHGNLSSRTARFPI